MAPSCSLSFFLLLLPLQASLLHLLHPGGVVVHGDDGGCCINAVYSFGDSIADTGNLLREGVGPAFAPIAHFPYGETAFNKPTGRCSDGLLMIDYLASWLKLRYLRPYLDRRSNFEDGVNFAVAGATALDQAFFLERGILRPFTNSSLDVQLGWFKTHLDSMCSSTEDCTKKLERSLFLVGEIGGNDYNYALFQGKEIEEVKTYVPFVVDTIIKAAEEVIHSGAVRLIVPGNFPVGCMPSYLTQFASENAQDYDERKCLKDFNEFASFHNGHLQKALENLRKQYPHISIMYADYYNAFLLLLDKAGSHGFDERTLLRACCGVGGEHNFDVKRMCGSTPEASACSVPSDFISWDGVHLTQKAYKVMAKELLLNGFIYPNPEPFLKWFCSF